MLAAGLLGGARIRFAADAEDALTVPPTGPMRTNAGLVLKFCDSDEAFGFLRAIIIFVSPLFCDRQGLLSHHLANVQLLCSLGMRIFLAIAG